MNRRHEVGEKVNGHRRGQLLPEEDAFTLSLKLRAKLEGSNVALQVVDQDDKVFVDLPWPEDWPDAVSVNFLKEVGFRIA
jgi:hypothetical protein